MSIDRNPVNLNESFQITFSASEPPDGSPDFTPLENDFEILNQQRSSNVSWINGQSSRNEQWVINAMAKHAGMLTIPPIAFGSDSSKALKVTVTDSPQASGRQEELFLDVQATPENPYVQSQVLYTLKIYFRVQISQSRLSDLEVKDALVEQLGEDTTYRTQIDGVEYGVLERKYAIFPQQSGPFRISPLTLSAEVVSGRQPRFNGFFNRQITETRRISSKAITLNVLPVPRSFTGSNWIGAESLKLTENWSDSRLLGKVGEPLTRTIRLVAEGTTVGQLPELGGQVNVDGLKTYPDQPILKEENQSDSLIAIREEKIAYIPSKPGLYRLPAVKITWFNTRTQKTEEAELPEVTIKAIAAGGSAQTPAPPVLQQQTQADRPDAPDNRFWQGLSAFFALGWLTTLLWFYLKAKKTATSGKPAVTRMPKVSNDKVLKAACRTNNPHAAKQALLQWGKQRFGLENLASIAGHCVSPLSDEIGLLNQYLYSEAQSSWNGQALWHAFNEANDSGKTKTKQDDALEPLFRL
ncbi:BatD family protein [Methylomonas sp. MgM2]